MAARRFWIALGLAAAAGLSWAWLHHHAPLRLSIRASGDCADGIANLIADQAELRNRWVVLSPGLPLPPDAHALELRMARKGADLSMEGTLDGRRLDLPEGPPAAVLDRLAPQLGLPAMGPELTGAQAGDAWELLDLAGRKQENTTAPLLARAKALAAREPRCASARLIYATLLTRYLVEHVDADTLEAQAACEQNFREGLAVLPGYPRLVTLFAVHLSDIGRQREALELLEGALNRHPSNPNLLNALAYAARTSGLLDLANAALERSSRSRGQPRGQVDLADNALLYSGRYTAFEQNLNTLRPGPLRAFYLGYARLLRKDWQGAYARFLDARLGGLGSSLFVRLAAVYRLQLEGHPDEALAELDALEGERTQIHLPDGEFTFKVAEAYGFLGHPGKALDVAERASVQGFGCLPWFERSPFLADARKLPKWASLDQHLRERQRLLKESFPPSAFGL